MQVWSLSMLVVAAALSILMITLAWFRHEKGMNIFAMGFSMAALGYFLLLVLPNTNLWFGPLLAQICVILLYPCLAWGIRAWGGQNPSWPWRFWLYFAGFLPLSVFFTLAWPNSNIRSDVESIFIIVFSLEFLIAFYRDPNRLHPAIKPASLICVGVFIAQYIVRTVVTQFQIPDLTSITNYAADGFSSVINMFFSIVWAGLILIIEVAGLVSELEKRNAELGTLATTDELTGLLNRHALEGKVFSEMERSIRYGEPLSLIMFDLDHFKEVNDTWGHHTGDAVLRQTAQITLGLIREPDNIYRWGGEEFIILAPHTGINGANSLAEKIRKAIVSDIFPQAGRISASFGVAQWQANDSHEHWFRQADFALYQAKNKGRNQVVCWQSTDTLPIAEIRLEWQAAWDSGDPMIDHEHRELVELARKILEMSMTHNPENDFQVYLSELIEHINLHFKNEEELLRHIGYPDSADHVALHQQLSLEAIELKQRSMVGEVPPAMLFDFLVSKVLIGHMLKSDSQYFPYIK